MQTEDDAIELFWTEINLVNIFKNVCSKYILLWTNYLFLNFSPQNGGLDCEGNSRGYSRICNTQVNTV